MALTLPPPFPSFHVWEARQGEAGSWGKRAPEESKVPYPVTHSQAEEAKIHCSDVKDHAQQLVLKNTAQCFQELL